MRILVQSPRFKRDLKKIVKGNSQLRQSIQKVLEQMLIDPFAPFLLTHKLKGKYAGLLACSCGFDCRIVFTIEQDRSNGNEVIVLTAIGTHDDVY
jgi:mRNA interferase YafQ